MASRAAQRTTRQVLLVTLLFGRVLCAPSPFPASGSCVRFLLRGLQATGEVEPRRLRVDRAASRGPVSPAGDSAPSPSSATRRRLRGGLLNGGGGPSVRRITRCTSHTLSWIASSTSISPSS